MVNALTCPNCGANTQNRHNCEYCGSMLVRFVDKGLSIDKTKYGKAADVIEGLEMALKNNLILQKAASESEIVITEIISSSGENYQIVPSDKANFGYESIGAKFTPNSEHGITIRIPFAVRSTDIDAANEATRKLNKFKNMTCFALFTPTESICATNYMIDFGGDYETASQMISEILFEIEGKNQYECLTNLVPQKGLRTNAEGLLTNQKDEEGEKKLKAWIKNLCLCAISILAFYFTQCN